MGFISDFFGGVGDIVNGIGSGFEDTVRGIGGGFDDLLHGDTSGFDDRLHDAFSGLDDMANSVPGGWTTVASLGGFGLPDFQLAGFPEWLKPVANGAIKGAGSAAVQGNDIGQGALGGAIGGGVGQYNPAGSLGVSNQIGQSAINSGIGSGLYAGATGQNVGRAASQGALTGGATTGIGQGLKMLGGLGYEDGGMSMANPSMFSPARNAVQDYMGYSQPTPQYNNLQTVVTGGTPGQDREQPQGFESNFPMPNVSGGFESPMSAGSPPTANDWFSSENGKRFKDMLYGAGNFVANNANPIAQGLMGLYSYNKANQAYKNQIGGLQGMYGQGSPYAQALRQQLDRRDAAAGRRSQYGPREVELQANLAQQAGRLAPTLQQLYAGQSGNRDKLMNTAFQLLKQGGAFNSLGQMFRQPQQAVPYTPGNYTQEDFGGI